MWLTKRLILETITQLLCAKLDSYVPSRNYVWDNKYALVKKMSTFKILTQTLTYKICLLCFLYGCFRWKRVLFQILSYVDKEKRIIQQFVSLLEQCYLIMLLICNVISLQCFSLLWKYLIMNPILKGKSTIYDVLICERERRWL